MINYFNSLDVFSKTLFLISFVTGIIYIIQTTMMFFGTDVDLDTDLDMDLDTDLDVDSTDIDNAQKDTGFTFGWLSFKNLINFLLIFSLTGLISVEKGLSHSLAIILSILSGVIFIFIMGFLFSMMKKLSQNSTPEMKDLVGEIGTVYLKIPINGTGQVKLTHGSALKIMDARSNVEIPRDATIKVIKTLGNVVYVEQINK